MLTASIHIGPNSAWKKKLRPRHEFEPLFHLELKMNKKYEAA